MKAFAKVLVVLALALAPVAWAHAQGHGRGGGGGGRHAEGPRGGPMGGGRSAPAPGRGGYRGGPYGAPPPVAYPAPAPYGGGYARRPPVYAGPPAGYAPPPGYRPNSLGADWGQQQDQARRGVRQGALMPLGRVMTMIRSRTPGRLLDAGLEPGPDGRPAYRVRWAAAGGRRIDFIVDAATGAILRRNGY